jgi:hypothetical protein
MPVDDDDLTIQIMRNRPEEGEHEYFISQAKEAEALAAREPGVRKAWMKIAEAYRSLASLSPNPKA